MHKPGMSRERLTNATALGMIFVRRFSNHAPPPLLMRQAGGNVLRLVGLYHTQRGAHTYFIKVCLMLGT